MLLSDISVKRPVFATVLSLLLVVLGYVSYERLSLREYPDIDPPIVNVEVVYPGAPANIVETRITELIEERVAGIEGIVSIESNSQDGRVDVTIEFSVSRDIDAAANDVRDRIAGISDDLPDEADPPEVQKVDSNDDVIIWRNLTGDDLSVPELTDYAERFLVDQYSALDGVARVRIGGGLRYALRIWLDHRAMRARNISVADVEQALRQENIELPAGAFRSEEILYKGRLSRNFQKAEDFERLTINTIAAEASETAANLSAPVRLSDIARIELGVEEDRTFFRGNEVPMVGIGIIRQSNANTIAVSDAVIALTEKLNSELPEGMVIEQSYNAAVFIRASIKEVIATLFIAVACVVFVIYLFLGSVRAMLIPALTVPVSITATFIAIYALGFSINLLTLLALVLAIGLVVDDAIVVLENIVRRMQAGESRLKASYLGTRQVGFAVIATTLVLIAVFVPITFLDGEVGQLFTEFALTIAAAVAFSSFVALTLCPMLASKILRVQTNSAIDMKGAPLTKGASYITGAPHRLFSKGVSAAQTQYLKAVDGTLKRPFIGIVVFLALCIGTFFLFPTVQKEFSPYEDRGSFFVMVNGPEGANYQYIEEYMTEIETRLMPLVESGEVKRLLVRAPRSFGNIENFNNGILIIILEPWSERRPAKLIMDEVRKTIADLPGVRAFPVMRQGLGGGTGKPVQVVIGGSTYEELAQWRDILLAELESNEGLIGLDSDLKETKPQLDYVINYEQAASLGVRAVDIGQSLETLLGGRRVGTFLRDGEEYDVIVEGQSQTLDSLSAIESINVRSQTTGALIPLSNLISIESYGTANSLSRYNRIRALTIEANLADGYALESALEDIEAQVRDQLPARAVLDYKGQSRDLKQSGTAIGFVFLLGLLIVFLVLAAQFESFIHPLVIMLTVPLAVGGGLAGLASTGLTLNIYSQIALIMLVGLAAKNGILIVEFANQRRDEGAEFGVALKEACATRFRPIIMTGLTTIAGALPLILASGAGSEIRLVIGVVVLAGVSAATLFTLFLVPLAYSLIAGKTGSPKAVSRRLESELQS